MQEQLDRIEEKLNELTVSIEHRITRIETTQKGVVWLIGTATAGVVSLIISGFNF